MTSMKDGGCWRRDSRWYHRFYGYEYLVMPGSPVRYGGRAGRSSIKHVPVSAPTGDMIDKRWWPSQPATTIQYYRKQQKEPSQPTKPTGNSITQNPSSIRIQSVAYSLMNSILREPVRILVMMMFVVTCRKSAAAYVPTFFGQGPLRQQLGRQTAGIMTRFKSTSEYSAVTMSRTEGLNAPDVFLTLARKLGQTPDQLASVLTQRLSGMEPKTDTELQKAEYLEWLLSGALGEDFAKTGQKSGETKSQPSRTSTPSTDREVQASKTITRGTSAKSSKQTFSTEVLFANRADLHPNSKRAVAEMGLIEFTEIQDKTFAVASSGRDVLGRARTGTGKTPCRPRTADSSVKLIPF